MPCTSHKEVSSVFHKIIKSLNQSESHRIHFVTQKYIFLPLTNVFFFPKPNHRLEVNPGSGFFHLVCSSPKRVSWLPQELFFQLKQTVGVEQGSFFILSLWLCSTSLLICYIMQCVYFHHITQSRRIRYLILSNSICHRYIVVVYLLSNIYDNKRYDNHQ